MRRLLATVGLVLVAGVALALVPAAPAVAHPLGNFTVNQFAGLRVQPGRVLADLVVDMAEIPAFQTRGDIDIDGDGDVDPRESAAFRTATCARVAGNLDLAVDGRSVPLRVSSSRLTFPDGAAGLSTLRLTCATTASNLGDIGRLSLHNRNYRGRLGWREIVAAGDGTTIVRSTVPRRSVSARLTTYPEGLLQRPLDTRRAEVWVRGGGARLSATRQIIPDGVLPRGIDGAARTFTDFVSRRELTFAFALLAFGASLLLGAAHAVAPGHGKTVMAAYIVGERGSLGQAALIGLTVTATHTAGVLVLGIVLSTSTALAPERLYPWLGVASGVLLAAVGAGLLRRALSGRVGHSHGPGGHTHGPTKHDHHHDHDHDHHEHDHPHAPVGIRRRTLIAMGVAGGLVPSPSALVVLLGAIALGRAWFGLALVVAYGIGMAVTLTLAGLALSRARRFLDARLTAGARPRTGAATFLVRALPVATAAVVCVVGAAVALRSAAGI